MLCPAVNQQRDVPTFLIETVSGQDGSPLGDCEVLVLDETRSDRYGYVANILEHGLQSAGRLEIMGTRWRTDKSGRLEVPTPSVEFDQPPKAVPHSMLVPGVEQEVPE